MRPAILALLLCRPFVDCPPQSEEERLRALMWAARHEAAAQEKRADRNEGIAVASVLLLLLAAGIAATGD